MREKLLLVGFLLCLVLVGRCGVLMLNDLGGDPELSAVEDAPR